MSEQVVTRHRSGSSSRLTRSYKTSEERFMEAPAALVAWGAPAAVYAVTGPSSTIEEEGIFAPTISRKEAWARFCAEVPEQLSTLCAKYNVGSVDDIEMTPMPGVKKFGYQMHMLIAPHGTPFKDAFDQLVKKHQLDRFFDKDERTGHSVPAFTFRHSQQGSRTKVGWWLTLGFVMKFE